MSGEQIDEKRKLRLYKKLKSRLVVEDYVLELDRGKRRQLSMLRGGTNKLRIEIGRWRGEKVEERVCDVCLTTDVEDEKHFLLYCPMYVRERVEMFERIREETEIGDIERWEEISILRVLIGVEGRKEGRKVRSIVLDYMRKAYEIRSRYVTY